MATTVGTDVLTLADYAKRRDPNGQIAAIIEILNETNEVLDDMLWLEGNLETGHKTTLRSGLPASTWRQINSGVAPTKSTTVQVVDTCGMIEQYGMIDVDLAMLNGNSSAFLLSENRGHIEGMSQDFVETLFYGDTHDNPERFMGFAPRYDDTTAYNGDNIILGSGDGADNLSIYLVCWGADTAHGIYPKGSKAGLQFTNKGIETVTDANGNYYEAHLSHFQWKCGLTVRDWRYVVRIANIDEGDLTKDAGSGSDDLVDLMVRAIEKLPAVKGRPAFYCNATIKSFLRRQITNRANVNLTFDTVAGKRVLAFDGIPVRKCDQLITETTLVS